jgi:hypothetical protein
VLCRCVACTCTLCSDTAVLCNARSLLIFVWLSYIPQDMGKVNQQSSQRESSIHVKNVHHLQVKMIDVAEGTCSKRRAQMIIESRLNATVKAKQSYFVGLCDSITIHRTSACSGYAGFIELVSATFTKQRPRIWLALIDSKVRARRRVGCQDALTHMSSTLHNTHTHKFWCHSRDAEKLGR